MRPVVAFLVAGIVSLLCPGATAEPVTSRLDRDLDDVCELSRRWPIRRCATSRCLTGRC